MVLAHSYCHGNPLVEYHVPVSLAPPIVQSGEGAWRHCHSAVVGIPWTAEHCAAGCSKWRVGSRTAGWERWKASCLQGDTAPCTAVVWRLIGGRVWLMQWVGVAGDTGEGRMYA